MKVTVQLDPSLAHTFARVRGNRVRLYDRKTKQLLVEHNSAQTVADGDTIYIPAITFTTA